ncbi:trifunctional serine/threonine-protein kinase/ATP-binding protein/sensor histidine kinase [Haliangium ochraceum]|uniref:trifunctional serine/threonine-protein kinase/ATP-binding protein/sensor histidine kinase n=1 Tax=Haliangium ochraceum TaxID=80816 RepID=UPI00019BAA1E|nr:trifunctional serine/threonine-protein kinase/ATP-binding protein/sensor histidine kinase [Haliangium ochraceum]
MYRGVRLEDERAVIVKTVVHHSGASEHLAALRREHEILRSLAGAAVPEVLDFVQSGDGSALVLEDVAGVSLDRAGVAGTLAVEELVALAIAIGEALAQVHEKRVIHKDICPANLLWNRDDNRVAIIDFGIATSLAQETTGFVHPRGLEGTLAYISPEQTGRMNRAIDYRTDYYSLGATLHQLASGRPPFGASDALTLVHCHIARQAPSLEGAGAESSPVPRFFAEIVAKLMAKEAADRYQSLRGLLADLRRGLALFREEGSDAAFPLGSEDRSERFHTPQKLYGRQRERDQVLDAFERASGGTATLAMVAGAPGIGKSALIREVYRPLTAHNGYFIAGKFDQYQNTPYDAFLQALRSLIAQIQTESPERLTEWQALIANAVEGRADMLVNLCPELAQLVGSQPVGDTLPPAEASNRLHQTVRAFLGVFAAPAHPLCMFLDDLQWADADTLRLLAELSHMGRRLPLLIIGAYRDNEVTASHPLTVTLQEIAEQGGHIERITLAPLGAEEVGQFVADSLASSREHTAPLAELLRVRTGGNPFFLREFLKALYEDGSLSSGPSGWQWDLERIRQRGVTENVVEFMTERIQRLPAGTQELLCVAASLGSEFELPLLALAAEQDDERFGTTLWPAIAEELVIPLGSLPTAVALTPETKLRCRFAHDRVQQAVLSALDDAQRRRLHGDVGRRLLQGLDEGAREQRLFEIVLHLNEGPEGFLDEHGHESLAQLNLQAAHKAYKAAASEPALRYAEVGIGLLGEEHWSSSYELLRDLHVKAASAAFAGGYLEKFDEVSEILLTRARDATERASMWKLQAEAHYAGQRIADALATYGKALAALGFELPAEVSDEARGREMGLVQEALVGHEIADLHRRPACTDPSAQLAMEILDRMITCSYTAQHEVFPIAICRLMQLSMKYGLTSASAYGCINYGLLLCYIPDFDGAVDFGRVSLAIADRFGQKDVLARTYVYAHLHLMHWKEPLSQLIAPMLSSYRFGMDAGDRFHASVGATTLCIIRFLAGAPLSPLLADMGRYGELAEQLHQPMILSWHQPYEQAALNLTRETEDPCAFVGPVYDEEQRIPIYRKNGDTAALFNFYYCKAFVAFVFGDAPRAARAAEMVEAHQAIASVTMWAGPWTLLDALCRLGVYSAADDAGKAEILEVAGQCRDRLALWRPHCEQSFGHKLHLVEAEMCRVQGQLSEAARHYDDALTLARRSGYVHETAIACELAARFHITAGRMEQARDLLREAHGCYLRWGAVNKVRALEVEHPQLLPRVATSALDTLTLATIHAGDWDVSALDLVGVLNASQALSREIERDHLLTRLMSLVVELAGAEAGALLFQRGDTWTVEALKASAADAACVLDSVPMRELAARGQRGVPEAVVHFVGRTKGQVVLDDARSDGQFGRDPYIARHQLKSVLCFPLARHGGQGAILYLENNLVRGAFTPARIHVLQLLSTQAVISLDNAMLYDTLEQKVETRTRELADKNQELATTVTRLRETQDRMVVQDRLASLGSLAAGIAHELRNPLNFVNNFARLSIKHIGSLGTTLAGVMENLETDTAHRVEQSLRHLTLNLSKIEEHGQRIDGIIRSMLAHAREGSGERKPTALGPLISEYATLAMHGMPSRDDSVAVTLDFDFDDALGEIAVVPQDIGRVIINLVDNACYALAKRGRQEAAGYQPQIRISTRDRDTHAEIRVRDNGTGIPAAARARVLDPFFTTKEAGEGTGLGLSIASEIVRQGYGGSFSLESEEGAFTEFVILLPKT